MHGKTPIPSPASCAAFGKMAGRRAPLSLLPALAPLSRVWKNPAVRLRPGSVR